MGLLQNLSKRGRLSKKIFDTLPQKIHAQADAAADAVRQAHDHGQADTLQKQGIPALRPADDPGNGDVTHGGKLLPNAQSRAERSFFQCHEPHMIPASGQDSPHGPDVPVSRSPPHC